MTRIRIDTVIQLLEYLMTMEAYDRGGGVGMYTALQDAITKLRIIMELPE